MKRKHFNKSPKKELHKQRRQFTTWDRGSESNPGSLGSKQEFWKPKNVLYTLTQFVLLCKPIHIYQISPNLETNWGHFIDETYIQMVNTETYKQTCKWKMKYCFFSVSMEAVFLTIIYQGISTICLIKCQL